MNIHEHQAKQILKKYGVPVPNGVYGLTVEELIEKSCQLLGIEIEGRDVYSQSKLLLDNMNKHDVDSIKKELENSQATDTLT